MKNKWKKAIPSLVYLLIAAVFYWQTFSIRQSTTGTIGAITPSTVPRVVIVCFALCALINLHNDIRREGEAAVLIQMPGKYLAVCAAFLFVGLFAKKIGFVICGIVFMGVLFNALDDRGLNRKHIIQNVVMAVVLSFVFCYAFRYGLNVRIPLYPR